MSFRDTQEASTPIGTSGKLKSRILPRVGTSKSISPIASFSSLERSKSKVSGFSSERRKAKRVQFSNSLERKKSKIVGSSSSSDGTETKKLKFSYSRKSKRNKWKRMKNLVSDDNWETTLERSAVVLEKDISVGASRFNDEADRKKISWPKVDKRRRTWKDTRYMWEDSTNKFSSSEAIRDAPPLIQDIQSLIDEPLFPRSHISPTDDIDFNKDAEYLQVPELSIDRVDTLDISEFESDASEEFRMERPAKTYKAPGPRRWISPKKNTGTSSYFDWKYFPNAEACSMWDKYMAKDAEEWVKKLRALPKRRALRNREIMLQVRKGIGAGDEEGGTQEKMKKKPRERKRRIRKRSSSSSSSIIVMHVRGFAVTNNSDCIMSEDSDNCDPESLRNRLEDDIFAREYRERREKRRVLSGLHEMSEYQRQMESSVDAIDSMHEVPFSDGEKNDSATRIARKSKRIEAAGSQSMLKDNGQWETIIESSPNDDFMAEARARSKKRFPLTQMVLGSKLISEKEAAAGSIVSRKISVENCATEEFLPIVEENPKRIVKNNRKRVSSNSSSLESVDISPPRGNITVRQRFSHVSSFNRTSSSSENQKSSKIELNESRKSAGSQWREESSNKRKKWRRIYKLDSSSSDSEASLRQLPNEQDEDVVINGTTCGIISKPRAKNSLSVFQRGINEIGDFVSELANGDSSITDFDENLNELRSQYTIQEESYMCEEEWRRNKKKRVIRIESSSEEFSRCRLSSERKSSGPIVKSNVPFIGPLWEMKKRKKSE